jgi:hypothetical protein
LPQLPQFSGSFCLSILFCSITVVVLVSVVVFVLAAEVIVVVVYDVLVVVAVTPAIGRDKQPHAELIRGHAKPLMGAPLQETPRFSISFSAGKT